MKNDSKKGGSSAILGSILGVILGKKRDQTWGKHRVRLGWRFGGILADLGLHFGLDFGTFSALEGEK